MGLGTQIKVIDLRSAKDTGIIFDGHLDRIWSLAKITRTIKVKKKVKGSWESVNQKNHFIISVGSDWEIRIWMVPATIIAGKTLLIKNGIEIEQDGEEYCWLLIKTKHKEQINSVLYMDDKIITGSDD